MKVLRSKSKSKTPKIFAPNFRIVQTIQTSNRSWTSVIVPISKTMEQIAITKLITITVEDGSNRKRNGIKCTADCKNLTIA